MKFRTPTTKSNNDSHKCIAPEELEVGVMYSFSFNPEEQFPLHGAVVRFKEFKEKISQLLLKAIPSQIGTYDCYIEVSKKGRLHLHGTIIVHDKFRFFLHSIIILQNNGCYEIDTISDTDKWNEYCWKNWNMFIDNIPSLNPNIHNKGTKTSFDKDDILNEKIKKGNNITKYLIVPPESMD